MAERKTIDKGQLVEKLSEEIRKRYSEKYEKVRIQHCLWDELKDDRMPHKDYVHKEKYLEAIEMDMALINAELKGWEFAREIVLNWGRFFEEDKNE